MFSCRNSPPCSPRHLWHIWPRDPMMIEEQIRKSLRTLLKLHRRDWHWETINLGDPKELQKKRPNPDWSNLWSLFCPGLVQAWQIFHVDRILKMQLQVLILTLYMPRTVHEFMEFCRKFKLWSACIFSFLLGNDNIFARNENIGKICKRTITWMDFNICLLSAPIIEHNAGAK